MTSSYLSHDQIVFLVGMLTGVCLFAIIAVLVFTHVIVSTYKKSHLSALQPPTKPAGGASGKPA